jgi:hypothetical protein
MEQIPNWLTDAVYAAGMTAYADDLDRKLHKEVIAPVDAPALEEPTPPLH